jgi:hypothetical protein
VIEIGEKVWVDKDHYRVVSDDGRTSYLYEAGGLFSSDRCVEISEHHEDGTTDAYEVDTSILGVLRGLTLGDMKGKHK